MDVLKVNEEALRQLVEREVERALEAREQNPYRTVSDAQAEQEMTEFILAQREKGKNRMTAFDFMAALRLPPAQIERILERFEKDGRAREVEE